MAFAGEYILRPRSWRRLFRFAGYATVAALSPSSYTVAARELAVRQIYLTAWRVVPGYLAFSAVLSLVLIEIVKTTLREYGLSQLALDLVLRALVLEVLPVLTALFLALRSGAAIGAEIALMRVTGELDDTEESGSDELRSELVPRITAAAFSVFALTTLSCALALAIAYVSFFHTSYAGFLIYTRVVGQVFSEFALAELVLKCLAFGAAVALIPLATGLEADRGEMKSVPFAVLAGLVKLFFVIGSIEVLSLVVKYV